MIVEHIIEPDFLIELAKSGRNCKDFLREFTKPSPRVVGEFPKFKNFRRLVLKKQAIEASEMEKLRLNEIVSAIGEFKRVSHAEVFDGERPFQSNLKQIELVNNSHICMLREAANEQGLTANILSIDEFEQGVQSLPSQVIVPKVAESISSALSGLLRLSKQITIVDPYFSNQPGVWNTFLLILKEAIKESPVANKELEVLFDGAKNNARSCEYLVEKLRNEHLDCLNQFSQVTFKDIRENGNEAIHNRYVITELAAVSLPYGLQETNECESDEFSLLSGELYKIRYNQYVEMTGVELHEASSIKN